MGSRTCAALIVSCLAGIAAAQQWPSKPIVFVSPGASDVAPRVIGEELSKVLGQQIVVDTHAGASGTVSAEYTLRQPADGHTFLSATSALMAAPYTFKVSFDVLRDFAPVSMLATAPFVLVAHPSLPVNTLSDLIELARKRPGQLNFSATAPGSSSNLTAELFKVRAGIDIVHVPHKTMGAALVDVLAGHVQLCMSAGPNAVALIKAGKLRGLAASTPKRSVVLPDVPTFTELGFPEVALPAWYGILARAGTPTPIISRMSAEIVKAIRKPDVREKLIKAAVEPVGDTPEEFGAFMKTDIMRWGLAAKAAQANPATGSQRK
ncbi:MAG: Bug family tripartite tricarboxylate transporter substrate binding protein [Burkholderiales bacterium]